MSIQTEKHPLSSRFGTNVWLSLTVLTFLVPAAAQASEKVFAVASKSIVVVHTFDSRTREIKQGSGVVVSKDVVVTNCHVLAGADQIAVIQKAQKIPARLSSQNQARDLCTIRVSLSTSDSPAKIYPASKLIPGQRVFALGAPKGLELTITEGLVSSLRGSNGPPIIQTSAAISAGSSGGGLFDEQGHLIGITTAKLLDAEGIGFALPSEWVIDILKPLASNRSSVLIDAFDAEGVGRAIYLVLASDLRCKETRSPIHFDAFKDDGKRRQWIEQVAPLFRARLGQSVDQAVNDALMLHYESVRSGLDPYLIAAMLDLKGAPKEKRARDLVGPIPVDRSIVNAIKRNAIEENDSLCFDFDSVRNNVRVVTTLLRAFLEQNSSDVYLSLRAYAVHGMKMDPSSVDRFPYDVWARREVLMR